MVERLLISDAGRALVSWIARETIYFGQGAIRMGYWLLEWAERS